MPMIIRRRSKPLPLQKLEAAIPRLPSHLQHRDTIHHEMNKLMKGYIGEKKVDNYTNQLPNHYTILHDVYLRPHQSASFQVDSLICTDNAIYLIEAKNFNDKIIFNTIHNQFTRITNNTETGYRNPITQMQTTEHKLADWLLMHGLADIPIYYFIAISDPGTIISVVGDEAEIARVVKHAEFIPHQIREVENTFTQKGKRSWRGRDVGQLIAQACEEFDYDILARLGVSQADVRPGVTCSACRHLAMQRAYGTWHCPRCEHKERGAHAFALDDYFKLGNNWLTNRACMDFLQINSPALATRLLKKSNLTYDPTHRRWTKPRS